MRRIGYFLAAAVAVAGMIGAGPTAPAHAAGDVSTSAMPKCNSVDHYYDPLARRNDWLPHYSGPDQVTQQCTMSRGDRGGQVLVLQQAYNHCYDFPAWVTSGADDGRITEDGIYGPETYRAVRYVQAVEGAHIDGIYGPETLDEGKWPVWLGYYFGPYTFAGCVYDFPRW